MSAGLIFKKIAAVMSDIEAISKSRDNKQQGFKFRGIDDVMNELHPILKKHCVFIVPEVIDEKREERQTKSGGVMTYVILKIKYTFFAEDGSSVTATMIGEGSDTGDKASNKAQSIALKYACLQVFAIPTEDDKDPDAESHEFKPRNQRSSSASMPQTKATANVAAKDKHQKTESSSKEQDQNSSDPGEYIVTFGKKYKGKKLKDIPNQEIENFIAWLGDNASRKGLPLSEEARFFKVAADRYLATLQPSVDWMNEDFPNG